MLKISEAASLAIHTATLLALNPQKRWMTREIAAYFQVSEAHLSKVLQRLTKAGLVKANRGPGGGFTLKKPANEVTLLDVYETIEGRYEWDRCLLGHEVCPIRVCLMGSLIESVNRQIRDYLGGTKLSDLTPKMQQ